MEMFVRAKSLRSIRETSAKVDRELRGAAAMVGAEVQIDDLAGYLPLLQDEMLASAFRENALALVGEGHVWPGRHVTASTDAGDLSHLMPVVHPSGGGFEGITHGKDFRVADEEMAYIVPAKAMATTVIDLLCDNAAFGRRVLQAHEPQMTKDEYLSYLRGEDLAETDLE
jgi:metal-dependent amidase/aminoacylase/carboxypeptidase family protein